MTRVACSPHGLGVRVTALDPEPRPQPSTSRASAWQSQPTITLLVFGVIRLGISAQFGESGDPTLWTMSWHPTAVGDDDDVLHGTCADCR
jgi:hypothetical protein